MLDLDLAVYAADIPADLAQAAHRGTSFVPEDRGRQERDGYARQLLLDRGELAKLATTDEARATLEAEFARYREGFRTRYVAMLAAKSRCLSTMITGGSNFPTRRNEKRGRIADKRTAELVEYRKRAIGAIRKALQPELAPIMAGDADAVTRLDAEIAKAEALQATMTDANAAIRKHAKAGPDAQIAALIALGHPEARARRLLEPDDLGRIGFADYQTKNNGANIRRMKARRAEIAAAKAAPEVAIDGAAARFEDSPGDNRVRLFYPGKPDAAIRTRLKSSGFRWAPSLGCWQAYRNPRSIEVARREAGIGGAS